ncbi:MAG: hypothetical protein U0414_30815 [Polyangiaceae bacterium]
MRCAAALLLVSLAAPLGGCFLVTNFSPGEGGAGGTKATSTEASTSGSTSTSASTSTSGGLDLGATCASPSACASGFCSAGKCCDMACDEGCGTCDANGHCAFADQGSACASATCASGELTLAGTCNSAGACLIPAPVSCGGYACDPAGAACLTHCTTSGDCVAPADCNAFGQCQVGSSSVGMACTTSCPDGAPCVDGYCCAAPCNEPCHACSNALTGAPNGQCASVTNLTDPSDDCPAQAPGTCGTTGACVDGACEYTPAGSTCGDTHCMGKNVAADECDGAGACVPTVVEMCSGNLICCAETLSCLTVQSCGFG